MVVSVQKEAIASALDAIAAYFDCLDRTKIDEAKRGWPEHREDLDLTRGGAILTVVATSNDEVVIAPDAVDNSDPLNVTWRVGYITIEAQLDLWAPYREIRDEVALLVQQNLHNDLPFRMGLILTSTNYFGRPLTAVSGGGRPIDDDQAADAGEWRQRWPLSISTDLVVKAASAKQALITVRATVDDTLEDDESVT